MRGADIRNDVPVNGLGVQAGVSAETPPTGESAATASISASSACLAAASRNEARTPFAASPASCARLSPSTEAARFRQPVDEGSYGLHDPALATPDPTRHVSNT